MGRSLAEEVVEHGAVKTCVRKGWANRVDETPMEAGGVTLWWEQLICSRRRPAVEPAEGGRTCRDRTGLRFGARQAILPRPGVRAMLSRTTRRAELGLQWWIV